jgi:hypothetical protein
MLDLTHLRMNIKQAKKLFCKEGTKRLRKQWQKAINRGKTPNQNS